MPTYTIHLTKEQTDKYVSGRTQGYRLKVRVDSAVGLDSKIFLYNRMPLDGSDEYTDVFVAITSPVDLEDYPEDTPISGASPALFRTDSIDLLFRNVSEMEETWEDIQSDIEELLRTLKALDEFGSSSSISFDA